MQVIGPGTLVDGRYRIVRRIGSGGMADVYCAEDTELGRQVALKLLHERFARDPEFVERFRREASAAAGLQHANVVQVFDRGTWNGASYIAMELLQGRNLKQILRDHGPLEPELATDLTIQILAAARFAHQRGVVHRDIKPHNVIVDDDGRVKVTDFGIALAGSSDMTETGSILGTAQYLSPEQAQGRPVDARSDLYSIGVVLYELLTGTVPFDAETAISIALKHVSDEPVPPSLRNPAVPPGYDPIVLHALRKDPAQRFQSADEFLAALQGETFVEVPVAPVAVVEEERPWRTALIVAGIVLALAALAVGAFLLLRAETETVPDVVGERTEAATRTLQDAGFEVAVVPIQSDSVPEDRVASQQPGGGEEAEVGSRVTINVSSGPGEAPVPLVQGLTVDEATELLRDAGFRSEQRSEFSDTVDRDRVIETSPAEGTSVRKGSTVTLVVSRGRERVQVPDVVGRERAEAEQIIRDAELEPAVTEREDAEAEPGTVLEQDPAAGEQLRKGGRVALVVATEPEPVPVPGVIDLPEEDAVQALEDAGFEVVVEERPVATPDEDGFVLDQDPDPDEPIAPGSEVTIVVGRFEPADPEPEPTISPEPDA